MRTAVAIVVLLSIWAFGCREAHTAAPKKPAGDTTTRPSDASVQPSLTPAEPPPSPEAFLAPMHILPPVGEDPFPAFVDDHDRESPFGDLFESEARPVRSVEPAGSPRDSETLFGSGPFARRDSFDKWLRYEDPWISFEFPDDPNVALEVTAGPDAAAVIRPSGPVDETFPRVYSLRSHEGEFCRIIIDRSDAFLEGTCFCGRIAHVHYRFRNGSLLRFAFLLDGRVKRVQALRGELRAFLPEWPHFRIHPDVYLQIALSVRLAGPPVDEEAMRQKVFDAHGFEGRLGFLSKPTPREEVLALLGEPARVEGDALVYVHAEESDLFPWGMRETTYRIPLRDGAFQGFDPNWRTTRELPPEPGTALWLLEQAGRDDTDPLRDQEADAIMERFVKLAPKAGRKEWYVLGNAAYVLLDRSHVDPRIPAALRPRMLEPELSQDYALMVLAGYEILEREPDLVVEMLEQAYAHARRRDLPDEEVDRYGGVAAGNFETVGLLLSSLGPTPDEQRRWIRKGMEHPHPAIRQQAYGQWHWLDDVEGVGRLRQGLGDPDRRVRKTCAEAFAGSSWGPVAGTPAHLPYLREQLESERYDQVREDLQAAIERLETMDPNTQ